MIRHTQKGIALYTALIVAAIVLLLATAMADIAFRQLILARASLNSQHAFYIANTGVECALYYDARQNIFPSNDGEPAPTDGDIVCAGADTQSAQVVASTGSSATTTFELRGITTNPETCAVVTVGKHEILSAGVTRTGTILLVDGRYPCDSPRSNERSIRVRYGFPSN